MIASLDDTVSVKLMLDNGRDGSMTNANGKISLEQEKTINGSPGRQIVFEIPEGSIPGGVKAWFASTR